jgi:hypothetical protein
MIYIDVNGNQIETFDLTKGYLVDVEWLDHPEVPQDGHYEYEPLEEGGKRQTYVVDAEYCPAWREVTVKQFIPYTEEELQAMAARDYLARLDAHDVEIHKMNDEQTACVAAYLEGVQNA